MLRTTNRLSLTLINESKKIVLAVAMLLVVGISSSFANTNNGGGNDAIQASFKKDFNKAELMATETGKSFTKLTFKMNDMILFAFYDENGDLLAVVRNIRSSQLPISLMMNLKNDYSDYWISDLFELTGEGSTYYYITLENADTKITLKSNGTSNWEVYSRKAKQ
jgi:hypothetical protein